MSLLTAPSAFRYKTLARVISTPVQRTVKADDTTSVYSTALSASIVVYVNLTVYDVEPTVLGSDERFVSVYYGWTLSLLRSIVPLFILTFLNVWIACAIWNRPFPGSVNTAPANAGRPRCRLAKNLSVTAMLVLVVVVFVVCIVPDTVMSIVFGVGYVDEQNRLAKAVRELTDALLALSSAVNFIVYCLCSRRFRGVLVETLHCGKQPPIADL